METTAAEIKKQYLKTLADWLTFVIEEDLDLILANSEKSDN